MKDKRLWAVLLGVALGRIAFAYQMQTVASLTRYFIGRGVDYVALGSLIGAYMLPGVFVALPLGLLGRRFGERRLMYAGLLLMTVGGTLPIVSPDLAVLAAGRMIAGTGAVALSVVFGKLLAELFDGTAFAFSSGVVVAAFPVGVGLSQMENTVLLDAFGWQSAFAVGAGLAAVSLVLTNLGYHGRPMAPGVARFGWPSRRECLLMMLCGLAWTFYNAGYYGFMSYTPALMLSRGVSSAETGWAMSLALWISVPAILGASTLAARFGTRLVFVLGAVSLSMSVAGIALSGHWLLWALLFGTVGALHPSLIIAAGTLSAWPENRSVGMGIFYTTHYLGSTLFPVVCGRIADAFGAPAAALLAAAGISLLTIPAFLLHQALVARAVAPCMGAPAT